MAVVLSVKTYIFEQFSLCRIGEKEERALWQAISSRLLLVAIEIEYDHLLKEVQK
jgi:hypothetical protein